MTNAKDGDQSQSGHAWTATHVLPNRRDASHNEVEPFDRAELALHITCMGCDGSSGVVLEYTNGPAACDAASGGVRRCG